MRHFTHTFILTLLILIGLTVTVNLIVDPYERFNLIKITNFNAKKYNGGSRITKAIKVSKRSFDVLIMGTSRAEIAFSTSHASWKNSSVYNLSLNAAHMNEVSQVFNYTLVHNPPKVLFLSLDLLMFNQHDAPNDEFYQSLFSKKSKWTNTLQTLIGFNTLNQSRKTVRRNMKNIASYYTTSGQRIGERVFTDLIGPQGQRKLFWRALENQYISSTYKNFSYNHEQLSILRKLIKTCQKKNVKLYIIIPPIHALQLETLIQMGLWNIFEQWKRDLLNATEHTGSPIYDFTSWAGINAEKLPSAEDTEKRMHWYWEASHFKEETGNKVIRRVLDSEYDKKFGVRLTQKNIDSHLQQQRFMRSEYIRTHSDDIHDLWQLLENNNIDIKVNALDNSASKVTFPSKVLK